MEFSKNTKLVMRYAEEYAKKSGGTVGTEHIMAGIMSVNCKTAEILAHYGVTKSDIPEFIRFGNNVNVAILSTRCKNMINHAGYLAQQIGASEITTEIIMLSILNAPDSVAVRALMAFGVDIMSLGRYLRGIISGSAPELHEPEDIGRRIISEIFGEPFMNGGEPHEGDLENMHIDADNGDDTDSGLSEELRNICHDLTAKAKAGKLDPVIGRGKEIDRIIQILSRRTKNNPVLIGEPGVGKSAIVEGLAEAIVEGNVPDILLGKKVLALDMASVVAGTKYRGEFEERLQKAINAIKKDGNIILFIDEIHTIVGAGASEGSVDAANILKPMLARGELHTIGATTIDEYRKYIEKDPALERRFQPITVDPPSVEDTKTILQGIREKYEKHHGVEITDSAISAAAELSDRYISDRFLPDKAIDLIDEAASKKRIKNFVTPDNVKEMEDKIQRLEMDIKSAARREEYDVANKYKKERDSLKTQCEEEKKKWSESRKEVKLSIDETDIADIVSAWTNIPVVKLTESEADRLLHLEDILKKRVVGQDEAVTSVAKAVRRARAGLKDPKKPIGTFIFLGPTGVGKTELTKALAEAMFGDEDLLIRLDMSEYMDKVSVSKLIGSAPGYVGFEEGGQLTEKVRRKPYSVVLFDEIEKAHPDVFNMLLQILDDGRLTDSHGRTVSFKNTIIIMTSNIGASEIKNTKLGFGAQSEEKDYEDMKERQMEALKRTMKPEFINRIDDIIIFKSLGKEDINKIADILINGLTKRLKEQNINIEVTDKAKQYVVSKGFNTEYGARPLKRAIQKSIEDSLSEQILMNKVAIGDSVVIDSDGDKLTFEAKK